MLTLKSLGPGALVALSLVGAACAGPQKEDAATAAREQAETVALAFAWPDQVNALVAHTNDKRRENAGQTQQETTKVSYRMRSSAVEEGLLVRYEDFSIDTQGADADAQAAAQLVGRLAAQLQPQFVVDRQGSFVRIDGVERVRAALTEMLDELLGDVPAEARAPFEQMMAPMLSEEFLTARANEEWRLLVGLWAGETFTEGTPRKERSRAAVPFLGGRELEMEMERSLTGRVACNDGDEARRCVRLRLTSRPDPEQVKSMLADLLAQIGQGAGGQVPAGLVINEFEMESEVVLVTEPDRLLPHRLEKKRRTRVEMSTGSGPAASAVDHELDTFVYSYGDAAAAPSSAPASAASPSSAPQ